MLRALFVLPLLLVPAVTYAQATREATIAAAQAAKAARLRPYSAPFLERAVTSIRRAAVESPSGPYPTLDSVYSGGGFTGGIGYRQFVGERTLTNVRALYSVENYRSIDAALSSPGHAGGSIDVEVTGGYLDARGVGYYGLGTSTRKAARANFRLQESWVGVAARLRPARLFRLEGALAHEDFDIGRGRGGPPSIEEAYTPESAPGIGESPRYLHGTATAALDWRPAVGYARRGGRYEAAYHAYEGRGSTADFGRVDVDLVQHVPLLRETWVLSGHARMQSIVSNDGQVPFFMLPSLGGGSSLRGYSSFRFRDAHSLLMQGEFRWMPNRLAMGMAVFYDAGRVASSRGALTDGGFRHDVGVGVRFHGLATTILRVEIAKGRDGARLVVAAKASF